MAIHPINTTEKIKEDYFSYLKTIKPFKEKWMREEFASAIHEPDMLVKGPILEISLPYKKSVTTEDLINEGTLSKEFVKLDTDELPLDRQLYVHQEKGIRKIVSGRSVVIATGTGSGKTETFLIPIINYLMREQENGTLSKPGVRALLLYPMNALANDQVKRLRKLLGNYPNITFGRYVGETEYTKKKAEQVFKANYPEEPFLENELKSREEMQDAPPHILLTNYAMLEYLLLRPEDSPLFDGPTGKHWHFIVLDEAHVYDGANATEIAMLIRRVQDRVVKSQYGRLQAIATSATLGGGQEDFPLIAEFAKNLFNQPVTWDEQNPDLQDVVEAERIPIKELGKTWGKGEGNFYKEINLLLDEAKLKDQVNQEGFENILNYCQKSNIPDDVIASSANDANVEQDDLTARFLFNILKGDENVHAILHLLEQNLEDDTQELHANPSLLTSIAKEVFQDDENRDQTIVDLIKLAVFARKNGEDLPLLPARYHLFARALEGAFICLNEKAHEKIEEGPRNRLFLKRQKHCPHCGSRVFEIANCTRCGTTYLIGDEKIGSEFDELEINDHQLETDNEYLVQSSVLYGALAAERTSFYLLDREFHETDEDELIAGEDNIPNINEKTKYEEKQLCLECGQIQYPGLRKCNCSSNLINIYKVDIGRKKTLSQCASCSVRGRGGIVYRFLTSQDAPVSIIADALYQELPENQDKEKEDIPGRGRKLLVFTDSRQNAAFFAPYIERAHRRILRRRVILKTILEDDQAKLGNLGIEDLLPRMQLQANKAGLFPRDATNDQQRIRMAIWLMQEFSPLDRRISLEGLGFIRIAPLFPEN